MTRELTLRQATPEDAVAIADLYTAARVAAVPRMPPAVHTNAEDRAYVAARLAEDDVEMWVAEADGELLGFASITETWLNGLYVRPDRSSEGIGTVLLELVQALRPDGLGLWVFETNLGAQRLYLHHGFVEVERTDGSDNEEKAPDIKMAWPGTDPRRATRAAYDEFAELYAARAPGLTPALAEEVNAFVSALPPRPRILEIGSGPGRDALALEAAGAVVDRTDVSPSFVALLEDAGHEARVLDPLTDELGGPYDAVWAQASLLHVASEELATVLSRLRTAVTPIGRIFLSLKEGDGEGWSVHGSVAAPRHFTYWREADLRPVLATAGWQVVSLTRRPGNRDRSETWLDVVATAGRPH